MRWRLVMAPIAMLSWHAEAHCAAPPEANFPEAVYYANAYADHYGIPRELVHAIIEQESGWNQIAVSNKGAMGLMQLMPATAVRFLVKRPTSIQDNIGGGGALSCHAQWLISR